ncbi:MAG: RNA polymerase sigma factor [Cyclobacteriaceae bacterium]|nr:RNA polymerase sigma factor [Cyclobacteriaceae bacterium]
MDFFNKNIGDEELIHLIKEGHQRYFSIFTQRYEKYILKTCKSYVKNDDVAEDLCQEVLIKVFLQLKKFRSEAKLTTWLFSIIHNTCIDYLRKNKKNVHGIITEKLIDEIGDIVDVEENLPIEKTVGVLDDLLKEMTSEEKLILLLKYKEKHSIKNISDTLGLSESALKMRLLRAKEKLNKLYMVANLEHRRKLL